MIHELCSSNSESKTKAKSCHETERPFSGVFCLFYCRFTFMIPFTTSRSFFFFFKDGLNAPFPPYDLSCMSLGHSTYHGHQSVQFSVTAVIIFSICPNTSPEQVPNGFSSFVLQQLERVPFWGGKAVLSMSRESPALCLQSTRDLWSLECF